MAETNQKKMKKIFVCGKGGSGKTTITSLLAKTLAGSGVKTIVVDGDGSNPLGIPAMLEIEKIPCPLIDFFGGIEKVKCPVDNLKPLTRIDDNACIIEKPLSLKEISNYTVQKGALTFLRSGKISQAGGGCTGPMGKIIQDLTIEGQGIILIDAEAGTEIFGRGIPKYADGVILIIDPTIESFAIAKNVNEFCKAMNIANLWLILNKISDKDTESIVRQEIKKKGKIESKIIGVLRCHPELVKAGLGKAKIGECQGALKEIKEIIKIIKRKKVI